MNIKVRLLKRHSRSLLLIGGLLFFVLGTVVCHTAPVGSSAKSLTFSVYNPKDLSPEMVIHADGIFTDYERRGFFRIGLMPVLVADNVRIEVQSVEGLTNILSALHSWIRPGAGAQRLNLKHLEIAVRGETQPCLRAAAGQIGSEGAIQLTSVSASDGSGHQMFMPSAALQLTGPAGGQLSWIRNGQPECLRLIKTTTAKTS